MFRIALAPLLLLISTPALAAASPNGLWLTDGQDSIVEIGQCGPTICGRVVRILKVPPGTPAIPVDGHNPDPKLRTRTIRGLVILSGFKDAGQSWAGTIYDPRAGKSYASTLTLLVDGKLKVQGCWGPFCKSVYFTRTRL